MVLLNNEILTLFHQLLFLSYYLFKQIEWKRLVPHHSKSFQKPPFFQSTSVLLVPLQSVALLPYHLTHLDVWVPTVSAAVCWRWACGCDRCQRAFDCHSTVSPTIVLHQKSSKKNWKQKMHFSSSLLVQWFWQIVWPFELNCHCLENHSNSLKSTF